MLIRVLGMGCDTCDSLYAETCAAVEALGLDAEVRKVEDLVEIVSLGVMESPALMADDRLLLAGRTAKKAELMKLFSKL